MTRQNVINNVKAVSLPLLTRMAIDRFHLGEFFSPSTLTADSTCNAIDKEKTHCDKRKKSGIVYINSKTKS
jgi:hypothetical protein